MDVIDYSQKTKQDIAQEILDRVNAELKKEGVEIDGDSAFGTMMQAIGEQLVELCAYARAYAESLISDAKGDDGQGA